MRAGLLVTVAALITLGCGSDIQECFHACPGPGESRCHGDVIQVCSADPDGCLQWMDALDCAGSAKACSDADGVAACVLGCTPTCAVAGSTRCAAEVVQTCSVGENGCLQWRDVMDCSGSGKICVEEAGGATCIAGCQDACAPEGATRCRETLIQVCADGPDGCLAWKDEGTDCADDSMVCDDSGGAAVCVDACQDACPHAGDLICGGDQKRILICTESNPDCLQWVVLENCGVAEPPKSCVVSGDEPQCVSVCADTCSREEDTRCDDNQVQSCGRDGNSCLAWTVIDACDDRALVCVRGTSGAPASCRDPQEVPEQSTILNGSFEQDAAGTVASSLSHWHSSLRIGDGLDEGILFEVVDGHAWHGDQSLHSRLAVKSDATGSECATAGGHAEQRLVTASARSTFAHYITLWTGGTSGSGVDYKTELRVTVEDDSRAIEKRLRCASFGYMACSDEHGESVPDYDLAQETQSGPGGLEWKRYTFEIPPAIDRSRLVLTVAHLVSFGRCNPATGELYLDQVTFSDADGTPL